jgi:hypothetical protein
MEAPKENVMVIDFKAMDLGRQIPNVDLVRVGGVHARERVPKLWRWC